MKNVVSTVIKNNLSNKGSFKEPWKSTRKLNYKNELFDKVTLAEKIV